MYKYGGLFLEVFKKNLSGTLYYIFKCFNLQANILPYRCQIKTKNHKFKAASISCNGIKLIIILLFDFFF